MTVQQDVAIDFSLDSLQSLWLVPGKHLIVRCLKCYLMAMDHADLDSIDIDFLLYWYAVQLKLAGATFSPSPSTMLKLGDNEFKNCTVLMSPTFPRQQT